MPFAQHLKVLVVDDTTSSRLLILEALNQVGIKNVTIAKDGEEGLKSMMASPSHLVISDLNMPKMDGIQLLKALRAYAPTKAAGFILLTGSTDRALINQARNFGLNNYLPKPFTAATLKSCVEAVVGRLT